MDFTKRPNSDMFYTEEHVELDGLFDLEIWEHAENESCMWVLAIRTDNDTLLEHTAIHDKLAARLIRKS